MKPLSKIQQSRIASNILAACQNIERLSPMGYNFIYLCPGFIAHCNRSGFQDHYDRPGSLAEDILLNQRFNQWANFRAGEPDADYYHSKRDAYTLIVVGLKARYRLPPAPASVNSLRWG